MERRFEFTAVDKPDFHHLIISHHVHLTEEEIYSLHAGEDVISVGIAVPVWVINGLTSEPAKEVFCNYFLENTKEDSSIKILDDGYNIVLPYRKASRLKKVPDEKWMKFTEADFEKHYKKYKPEISSRNLLNFKDGGSESLYFREHNSIKTHGNVLNIVHYVNIENIKYLIASLDFH